MGIGRRKFPGPGAGLLIGNGCGQRVRVSGARFAFAACGYVRGYFEAGPLRLRIFRPDFFGCVCAVGWPPVILAKPPGPQGVGGCLLRLYHAPAPGCACANFPGLFWPHFLRKLYRLRLLYFKRVRAFSARPVLKLSSVSSLKYAGVCIWLCCLMRWLRWLYRCGHVLVIIERAKLCIGFCALYCYGSRWYLYTFPGLYPFSNNYGPL